MGKEKSRRGKRSGVVVVITERQRRTFTKSREHSVNIPLSNERLCAIIYFTLLLLNESWR